MANTKSIYLPFSEKALDATIRDHLQGDVLYIYDRDNPKSVPGLALKVPPDGIHTYQLIKKIHRKMYRRNLGDRRTTSVVEAREDALALIKQLKKGVDPKEERRQEEQVKNLQKLTYRQALNALLDQSSSLAEGTRRKYRASLTTTFKELADKPLGHFTERRVKKIHEERSEESRSRADQDFRVLRLVWNWARDEYKTEDGMEVLGPNPVSSALNKRRAGTKGWNNVPRKETIIPKKRLPDWFQHLYRLREEEGASRARRTTTFLLEALVLSGLRFNELATLTPDKVDFENGALTVPDTSSKNRKPLVRPLTTRVREIVETVHSSEESYVFPGRLKGKPLNDTRPVLVGIQEKTGLQITPHDLRRVWVSAATRAQVPMLVQKRLLNHLTNSEEVTEGYARFSLDELLEYSQAVEDEILRSAGLVSRSMEDTLAQLLQDLPEDEKRKLIFELSQRNQEAG